MPPPAEKKFDSQLRRNMRLCVIEGVVAMPLVFLSMPGNFLLAGLATDTLQLGKPAYGLLASLPAWCNVLQLFLVSPLSRRLSQKSICLGFSWFHLAAWVALAVALPHLPRDGSWATATAVIALFAVSSFAFAVVNISWTSWVQEWLPKKARGKYFGRRNRILQGSSVLFLLLSGQAIAHFQRDDPVRGYQLVIALAVLLRLLSIVLQQRILHANPDQSERQGPVVGKLAAIRRNKPLFRFILFGGAFGFLANFMGPFFPVFFYDALEMNVAEVGGLVTIATVAGALSMPKWGELCDQLGCRSVMGVALSLWMANGYGFLFASPQTTWVLYPIFALGGLFGAGFLFGSFNMILKLVPPEAKTAAISLNMAVSSLAGALSPVVGGAVIEWAQVAFDDFLRVFHVLSAVHHTLLLCLVPLLFAIEEPKSVGLRQAIGAMRSYRQIGALLGLSFLVNYSFIKRPKPRRPTRARAPRA